MYYSLVVISVNEELYEKCWSYMRKYYQHKFPPEKAAVFEQIIDSFPPVNGPNGHQLVLDSQEF